MITHVVALSKNLVIGKDNKLPWHLPEDLKHFKEVTQGKIVVMGSNTFRSILSYSKTGLVLPGRSVIVISSSLSNVEKLNEEHPRQENVSYWTKPVLDMALKTGFAKSNEFYIVGGSQLYATYPPDKIIATCIDKEIDGDSYYPYNLDDFYEVSSEYHKSPELEYSFKTYVNKESL